MDFSTGGLLIGGRPKCLLIWGGPNSKKNWGSGGWLIWRGWWILTWHYLYRIRCAGWQLKFTRGAPNSMQMMLLGFLKGMVERTENHQWLQASGRTRATLVRKMWCSCKVVPGRRCQDVPGKILQVPFAKVSVENRAHDFLEMFSSETAVPDPCVTKLAGV